LSKLLTQSGIPVTLCHFLRALWEKEIHQYFMQDGAITHTADYAITVLSKMFENRLINRGYGLQGLQT
jgi:hypothetical protein